MPRILVIDDDELMHIALNKVLGDAGYEVINAYDGTQGLAMFKDNPADLIITDIIMPGPSGIEVIEKFKRDHPDVAIFTMSGGLQIDGQDFLKMAGILGAKKTFRKPVDMKALLAAVKDELKSD